MSARLAISALLLAAGAAQADSFPFEEADASIPTHFVSVQTGVNLGLVEVAMQSGHLVAGLSGNLGWAVTSGADYLVVDARFGYAWALSPPNDSMWFFDLTADVVPGRIAQSTLSGIASDPNQGLFCAFGMSLGFRYVHRSGLVLGFRFPLLGLAFGDWVGEQHNGQWDLGSSVLGWFVGLGLSTSLFTVGLRF